MTIENVGGGVVCCSCCSAARVRDIFARGWQCKLLAAARTNCKCSFVNWSEEREHVVVAILSWPGRRSSNLFNSTCTGGLHARVRDQGYVAVVMRMI